MLLIPYIIESPSILAVFTSLTIVTLENNNKIKSSSLKLLAEGYHSYPIYRICFETFCHMY